MQSEIGFIYNLFHKEFSILCLFTKVKLILRINLLFCLIVLYVHEISFIQHAKCHCNKFYISHQRGQIFTFLTFLVHMRRYWFYVKNHFRNSNLYVLRSPESEKTLFTKVPVQVPISIGCQSWTIGPRLALLWRSRFGDHS